MILRREWYHASPYMRAHGTHIWDEWGWIGLAIKRLTFRLWWVGQGSTYRMGINLNGFSKKCHSLSIGKYHLIEHVIFCSSCPTEKRDQFHYLINIKIGRVEFDIALYKIDPSEARPDLWGNWDL